MSSDIARNDSPNLVRLECMSTDWNLVDRLGDPNVRRSLVELYYPAIHRYAAQLLHGSQVADEIAQNVALHILQGRFGNAAERSGKFRQYLKVAIWRSVKDHFREQKRRPDWISHEMIDGIAAASTTNDDEWQKVWQRQLLDVAFANLHAYQASHPGNIYHTLLRLKAEHSEWVSKRLAEELTRQTGRKYRADGIRQQLVRARRKLAQLLVRQVAKTVENPTRQRVIEELEDSGLKSYVEGLVSPDWQPEENHND